MGQEKQSKKTVTVAYKIQMLIEIEGEIEGQPPLMDDTGITPMITWAADDIEKELGGICDIIRIKNVELKEL